MSRHPVGILSVPILFVGLACFGLWLLSSISTVIPEAAEPRLFEAGTVYHFVWNCNRIAVVGAQTPVGFVGCVEENLLVEKVRKDGWLTVRDEQGVVWDINPARAAAVAKLTLKVPASSPAERNPELRVH